MHYTHNAITFTETNFLRWLKIGFMVIVVYEEILLLYMCDLTSDHHATPGKDFLSTGWRNCHFTIYEKDARGHSSGMVLLSWTDSQQPNNK